MFSCVLNVFLSTITFLIISHTCICELPTPASLYLYSPGEVEYTEVIVRRLHDNLTLLCELRGDISKRDYVWNFVPDNGTDGGSPQPLLPVPELPHRSKLVKLNLTAADSGRYMCSAPPFSQSKYILVQTAASKQCARGAFSCGQRCVLPAYVCDGRADCVRAEDEAAALCRAPPCAGPDKLNCSSGRCVPAAACCAPRAALCTQPRCCDEHPRYSRAHATFDDFPLPPEDRHAPDDYGFIQSTIYTVTACALIFMIAVVLLVSAICKMHMKRAALRSYAAAERARRHAECGQPHRFPPCYEAARLLEPAARSPSRGPLQCAVEAPNSPDAGFGLGRLSEIFSSRYRQVPSECLEVEMQAVRPPSLSSSPARQAYIDSEFYFTSPEGSQCGRELNSMATPVEFFRRRALRRNTLERVMDRIGERQRPFTLQLGRFQLSIPKFGRRSSNDRRPDTPNVAEIDIDDLDFVRLNSNDTYTLNGRTIRLLGANFENYPVLPDGSVRPPPYTEAMRYKLYGPPPEYLSRDGLNGQNNNVDEEARNNVEMPPNYDELGENNVAGTSGINNVPSIVPSMSTDTLSDYVMGTNVPITVTSPHTSSGNNNEAVTSVNNNNGNTCSDTPVPSTSNNNVVESIKAVIDNLPAIDSDVNANEAEA
ncbi:uncharacterized protein LOC128681766 [Plodia interpunctella]|uniref:uncharacterized protein LOC128681766 n=1 Tax=Plodia interpunctella TaxID=58824 RepID=UPI002368CA3C|nr:uncharacterized protein LOC128681766 [Plodia interpunctella]